MKSEEILAAKGIEKDNYPADAIFSDKIIGTYSKDMQTVCIMIEDNLTPEEQANFNNMILSKDIIEEIAYTVKNLITNFGCEVHSYTMKNISPFNNLKIIRP